MSNYEIFERLRDLKIQIAKLREDYKRQTPTVQSPKLDGMPKQLGAGDAGHAGGRPCARRTAAGARRAGLRSSRKSRCDLSRVKPVSLEPKKRGEHT